MISALLSALRFIFSPLSSHHVGSSPTHHETRPQDTPTCSVEPLCV
jgi:hypothetical protein